MDVGITSLTERYKTLSITQADARIGDCTILIQVHHGVVVRLLCKKGERTLIENNAMALLLISKLLHFHYFEVTWKFVGVLSEIIIGSRRGGAIERVVFTIVIIWRKCANTDVARISIDGIVGMWRILFIVGHNRAIRVDNVVMSNYYYYYCSLGSRCTRELVTTDILVEKLTDASL